MADGGRAAHDNGHSFLAVACLVSMGQGAGGYSGYSWGSRY